jgi:hypothetical protein
MTKKRKGRVSQETFNDFLADQGVLEACENHAIKEIVAEEPLAGADASDLARIEGEVE